MRRVARIFLAAIVLSVAACGSHHSPAAPTPPVSSGDGTGNGGSGGGTPPPPPPPPPPTLKITKILCFGDSITYGVVQPAASFTALNALDPGDPASYPYKLQALENARYTSQTITVWNDGNPGEAAEDSGTYDRLIHGLTDTQPDVLLLMEGDNDLSKYVSANPSQNGAITTAVNAMEDMVRGAQARGVAVFVATLPPQRPGAQRSGDSALVAPYNTALRAMIAKKGATLVDMNALFPVSLIGLDGLHPTADGYEKMAEIFQAALAAVYEVPPATSSVTGRR